MKKFNWIDAVIILLVVAVGIGGFWFLNGRGTEDAKKPTNVKVNVTVEMKKVTQDVVDAYVAAKESGQAVTLGATNVDAGVVTDVKYEAYTIDMQDTQKGEFVTTPVEGYFNANITMTLDGAETDLLISSANEKYRIGEPMVFHGKGFAGDGYIVGLTTEKEAK